MIALDKGQKATLIKRLSAIYKQKPSRIKVWLDEDRIHYDGEPKSKLRAIWLDNLRSNAELQDSLIDWLGDMPSTHTVDHTLIADIVSKHY